MFLSTALLATALANPVPALSGRGAPGLNQPSTPQSSVSTERQFASRPLWATNPWVWRSTFQPPPTTPVQPAPRVASEPVLTAWQKRPDHVANPGEVILFSELPSGLKPIPEAHNHLPIDPTADLAPPPEATAE